MELKSLLVVIAVLSTVASILALIQFLTAILLLIIMGIQLLKLLGVLITTIAMLILSIMGLVSHRATFLVTGSRTSEWHHCGGGFAITLLPLCFVGNIVCALILLITIVMNQEIEQDIKIKISDAMYKYSNNLGIRMAIDHMQMKLHCCGAYGFMEYFQFDWMSSGVEEGREFTSWENVPFSCCNKYILKPCLHADLKYEGQDTLYRNGCVKYITKNIREYAFFIAILTSTTGIIQAFLLWHICKMLVLTDHIACWCPYWAKEKQKYEELVDSPSKERLKNGKKQHSGGWPQGRVVDGGSDELPSDESWDSDAEVCGECDLTVCMDPSCHEYILSTESCCKSVSAACMEPTCHEELVLNNKSTK